MEQQRVMDITKGGFGPTMKLGRLEKIFGVPLIFSITLI